MEQPEQTDLAIVEPSEIAKRELLTIDPLTYVTAVYAQHHTDLAAAIAAIPVTIDMQTTAGYKRATTCRATFRGIRTSGDATRKLRKAPILEIGKMLESHYKALEAEVTPYETQFDTLIKDEDARKEAIKAEKARVEAERVDAIRFRIDAFGLVALDCAGKSSEHIQGAIDTVTAVEIDASFQEFSTAAISAKQSALEKLDLALDGAKETEAEQARAKAEREEFERQLKQQQEDAAALAAERKKLDAERAEQERAAQAQADALTAQRAELKHQQDALAAQQEAARIAALPKPEPTIIELAPAPSPSQSSAPPRLTSVAQAPRQPLQDTAEIILAEFVNAYEDGSEIHMQNVYKRAKALAAQAA